MDYIHAFISYYQQNKLQVIAAIVSALCWVGTKLVNRYYDRKARKRRDALHEELRRRGMKPPPDIPRPPE